MNLKSKCSSQNSKQTNKESAVLDNLTMIGVKDEVFYPLENNLIKIFVSTKGGQITKANLKKFDNYLKNPLT